MEPTKQDLINGRDFWIWALDNPRADKDDWPEYERIENYDGFCPFCEFWESCTSCPLGARGMVCNEDTNNPYEMWVHAENYNNKDIKKAIQKIIDVYQEEIDKLT